MNRQLQTFAPTKILNLDSVSVRPLYVTQQSLFRKPREADVTQLGDIRWRKSADTGIQMPEKIRVAGPVAGFAGFINAAPTVVRPVLAGAPMPEIAAIQVSATYRYADAIADIGPLQVALRPGKAVSDEDVYDDPAVQAVIDRMDARQVLLEAGAVGVLSEASGSSPNLNAVLLDLTSEHEEAMTVVGGGVGASGAIVLSARMLQKIEYVDLLRMRPMVGGNDPAGIYEEYLAWRATEDNSAEVNYHALGMRPLSLVAESVRARIAMSRVVIPAEILASMVAANPFADTVGGVVVAYYREIHALEEADANPATDAANRAARALLGRNAFQGHTLDAVTELRLERVWLGGAAARVPNIGATMAAAGIVCDFMNDGEAPWVKEFAYAAMTSQMVAGAGALPAVRAAGGVSVAAGMCRGMYIDPACNENNRVARYGDLAPGISRYLDVDALRALVTAYNISEGPDICHCARINSYLKSGHSGSAAGLVNTVQKLAQSVACAHLQDIAKIEAECPASVYHCVHGLSIRLMAAYYYELAASGNLNYAFARRLLVNAPGTGAYIVAEKYFTAMDRGQFFTLVGIQPLYDRYMQEFKAWQPTAQLEAPYAQYMYGEHKESDEAFKSSATQIMAYAAHIEVVMTKSTIAGSLGLARVAAAASNNDVVAGFHVAGYAAALANFVQAIVKDRMRRNPANGNRLTIE